MDDLARCDPQVHRAVAGETARQLTHLEMIASENFVSPAVREVTGSVFTHKYAEGVPGRRYYGGCEFADQAEELARARATALFAADHANVQPHSGAQANMAGYFAFLDPGDRILGMNLSHGGHLTHGSPVNFSGRYFDVTAYGVRESDGRLDYDAVRDAALRTRPKMIVAGASAYPRIIDFAAFGEIAREACATLLVDMAHVAGLVAGGHHPTPVPHADVVTTTTHKTLRGPRGGMILCRAEHAKSIDKMVFPCIQGGPLLHVIAAKAVALGEALAPASASTGAGGGERPRAGRRPAGERRAAGVRRHRHPPPSGGPRRRRPDRQGRRRGAGPGGDRRQQEHGAGRDPVSLRRFGPPDRHPRPHDPGMGPDEMRRVGGWIADVIENATSETVVALTRRKVEDLCRAFPLFRPDSAGGAVAGATSGADLAEA